MPYWNYRNKWFIWQVSYLNVNFNLYTFPYVFRLKIRDLGTSYDFNHMIYPSPVVKFCFQFEPTKNGCW